MRSQDEAVDDAQYHAAQLVDALQDAAVKEELLEDAEKLQSKVSTL